MAKNLRAKIQPTDELMIHDVNTAVTEQFSKEVGNVKVAQNVREVAENSVRAALPYTELASSRLNYIMMICYCSIYDLSWQRKLLF